MEIKTTKDIIHENYMPIEHNCMFNIKFPHVNYKWVRVDDVLRFVNILRKSNEMWSLSEDEAWSKLENELEGD
jgi:hypothetical protein